MTKKLYLKKDKTPYIHLNNLGNEVYWDVITKGLKYNLGKWGYLNEEKDKQK